MKIGLGVLGVAVVAAGGIWLVAGGDGGDRSIPVVAADGTTRPPGTLARAETPLASDAGTGEQPAIAASAFRGERGDGRATDLRVKLVDSGGAPLPDIGVGLRDDSDPDPTALRARGRTTAPDGIVRLPLRADRPADALKLFRIVVFLPVVLDPPVLVSGGAATADPVVVTLPPTGSLEVRLRDERGKPVPNDEASTWVSAPGPDGKCLPSIWSSPEWSTALLDEHGCAVLPRVGIGIRFRATAMPRDNDGELVVESAEAPGPRQAGERARLEIIVRRDRFPVVTGRLVRNDGTPWPASMLEYTPTISPSEAGRVMQRFQVTTGGRFRMPVRLELPPGGSRVYVIEDRDRGRWPDGLGPETRLELSRALTPGENEIGDVVLDLGPVVVSGEVVDEDGTPVANAGIEVTTPKPVPGGVSHEDVAGGTRPISRLDGRFEIRLRARGELPAGEMKLAVSKGRTHGRTERTVSAGTQGLRIVLPRLGALAGSVRLTDALRSEDLAVEVHAPGSRIRAGVRKDGTFGCEGVPAGAVTVLVIPAAARLRRPEDPALARIEEVIVTADAGASDPRLQDIVIPEPADRLTVRVLGPDRLPLGGATVRLDDGGRGGIKRTEPSGEVSFTLFSATGTIEVGAPGLRSHRREGVRGEIEVQLERGIEVRLKSSGSTGPGPVRYWLRLHLARCDAQGRPVPDPLADADSLTRECYAGGETVLSMPAAGTYRVDVRIVVANPAGTGPAPGQTFLVPEARKLITVADIGTTQSFDIEIPEDQIATRLKSAGR